MSPRPTTSCGSTSRRDWARTAPRLNALSEELNEGRCADAQRLDYSALASPFPRAYEFVDGSAYLPHVERVRKALTLRRDIASRLGFTNWAEYRLSTTMAGRTGRAYALIDSVQRGLIEKARQEMAALEALIAHQPPPVHQTFEGDGFVICSFVPRLYDFHPEAVPAPYNHSNVMTDEVIYYCNDEFMSRAGIETGSVTHHPDGLAHGPQPGRTEASIGQKKTDELAVMVDTFAPLNLARGALACEDEDYGNSWLGDDPR